MSQPSFTAASSLPESLTIVDRQRLRRRLDVARKERDPAKKARLEKELGSAVEQGIARFASRAAASPIVSYPEDLPIAQRRDDILEAIREHQVVIIAGETGSGKTTQIPKMCLELGRGIAGQIGHTQPRRIAARAVSERLAEELKVQLGAQVGYQVRFADHANADTLIKVMTDGILLAEIQRDRTLSRYDTIIIDEAHERSLNIDFILGYLKELLPRRPDLKVIVTSATIDPERFANHFAAPGPDGESIPAPIIEVSGRTYPVDIRYRPLLDDGRDVDVTTAIVEAVEELTTEPGSDLLDGDILIFLSGEREIRDTADVLTGMKLRHTEIVPLYARLSSAEQHRVFSPHTGRRIVLATNVAETSLTVPGIRYVIDPGTARISRYSHRTKVQRLPIEPVSQASANQRAGRCGRVAAGICIRLYSEEDFLARPEFTDPEILRTNLASVILQMTALGLGEVARFPFVEPPDARNIRDGVTLLRELGAIEDVEESTRGRKGSAHSRRQSGHPGSQSVTGDAAPARTVRRLTPIGRSLVELPIDPRLARMVVEANNLGCLREVLVIAAALSIQDPRERPLEHQQAAQQQHARFADPTSDFMGFLKLWKYILEQQKELSGNQFRRRVKAEFLNYLRVREWQDLHAQLAQVAKQLGFTLNPLREETDADAVHQALLSGLLSQIGLREATRNEYFGARGAKFAVFPGSALSKKPPEWVMAAELVETSRLWARVAARINPEWAERLGQHLVVYTYSEPRWSAKRGSVMASEKVLLYGIPLVAARPVAYGKIDPELSRELFIRHALVEGDWHTTHRFFRANRDRLDAAAELEHRARRRDIVVDDETLFAFYDERIPQDIVSATHFDAWWKQERQTNGRLLDFDPDMLVTEAAADVDENAFPTRWRQGDLDLALDYRFEPGSGHDGVSVHIPVDVLNRVNGSEFDWLVPGLREELTTAMIRSLPKPVRKHFVPAPNFATLVFQALADSAPEVRGDGTAGSLFDAVARELTQIGGFSVSASEFDRERIPGHLSMTYVIDKVEGKKVTELGASQNLVALQRKFAPAVAEVLHIESAAIEQSGLTDWPVIEESPRDEIPKVYEQQRGPHTVRGYPALVVEPGGVALRVLATPAQQSAAMPDAVRRLVQLAVPSPVKGIVAELGSTAKLALASSAYPSVPELLEDCVAAAIDSVIARDSAEVARGGSIWDRPAFDAAKTELLAVHSETPARPRSGGTSSKPPLPKPPTRREPEKKLRAVLVERTEAIIADVVTIVTLKREVDAAVKKATSMALLVNLADVQTQTARLTSAGFVSRSGAHRLPDVARYLRAVLFRLEKMADNAARDRQLQWQVEQVAEAAERAIAALPVERRDSVGVREIGWMIEEFRVSLWAQQLGTPTPISEKRILKALREL